MNKLFTDIAWENYLYWQQQDRKILKRINMLLKDIERNKYHGLGKLEKLKGDLSEWYSVRIDKANRIVFKIENDTLYVLQCRTHYER
ncbi:Txe/YoeB family addiction module toxin [Sporolactobacillus shoreicorticis]|uniref:Endoribonuclease YoeB n=2 Tax=Sporolactobacillus shoreicorticis TaxID=1923877 RepID=A0ABW5S2C7_9BACL|nr:Txe/YoeB family addiction module toxin [Sporolactobacillus shoreicorticis]